MKECCRKYLGEQLGNDMEVINEIYDAYVSSIGDKMAEADAAVAAGVWDSLDKVAHAIKGNALTAGDQQMADTAIELRNAAKLQAMEHSAQLISQIEQLSAEL